MEIRRASAWRAVAAAAVGNLLEWFDFAIYAFFALLLAEKFFPNVNHTASLLATFAAYGVGFVVRPLGGVVIGRVGDVKGRKPALLFTISCMAAGTIGIGLLPTYETAGILAPTLLVILRAVQGFATGGEWGTSAAFMVEWAPRERRGFYSSFQNVSSSGGALMASAIASLLAISMPAALMNSWGWRLPFVLGGAMILAFGLWMRLGVGETPEFVKARNEAPAMNDTPPFILALKAMGFTMFWSTLSYLVSAYMVTFTQQQGGLTRTQALWTSSISLLILVLAIPFVGHLSDRIGRKPLLLTSCACTAVLCYPILSIIASTHNLAVTLALQITLSLFFALFQGPAAVTICEIFPTRLRSTWMTPSFALAAAVFGGFMPFNATWLIAVTKLPASPAFLLIPAGIVSAFVIWTLPAPAGRTDDTTAPPLP